MLKRLKISNMHPWIMFECTQEETRAEASNFIFTLKYWTGEFLSLSGSCNLIGFMYEFIKISPHERSVWSICLIRLCVCCYMCELKIKIKKLTWRPSQHGLGNMSSWKRMYPLIAWMKRGSLVLFRSHPCLFWLEDH